MRTHELSSQESGAALVELAFTLPMFLLLVLGTAEVANIAWASIQLNNAAHAAAQFGSLKRANAADTTDLETAAQNEAPALTITFPSAPVIDCTCVTPSTGAETSPVTCTSTYATTAPCASPNVIFTTIHVTTQAVVKPLIHYPGLPASYTLQGNASMGIVQ